MIPSCGHTLPWQRQALPPLAMHMPGEALDIRPHTSPTHIKGDITSHPEENPPAQKHDNDITVTRKMNTKMHMWFSIVHEFVWGELQVFRVYVLNGSIKFMCFCYCDIYIYIYIYSHKWTPVVSIICYVLYLGVWFLYWRHWLRGCCEYWPERKRFDIELLFKKLYSWLSKRCK